MGFNRVGSSNAGALVYHNAMSKVGRCVASYANQAWYTYGDGNLARSHAAALRVTEAAALSAFDFLSAFVRGEVDREGWQAVWSKLPAYYDETVTTESDCVAGENWPSLRTVSRPAQAVYTYEMFLMSEPGISPAAPTAIMLGAARDFGLTIPIGYRTIRNRVFAALGTTVEQRGTRPRAYLFDVGYVYQIGTTNRGLLTHEIGFGELLYYRPHNDEWDAYGDITLRVLYAVSIEFGPVYVRLQAGHTFNGTSEPNVSAGVGWVRASAK
jgi:hypothetical protein